MAQKYKVKIMPMDATVEIDSDENILSALKNAGFYIKSSCGGHASCGDCIVKIKSGEDNLESPPFSELKLLGNVFHITKERLSCQTKICGDITVDISNHDKTKDENKLGKKTSNFQKKVSTKIRKDDEIKKVLEERYKEKEEKFKAKIEKEDKWKKHWEKDPNAHSSKSLAGGKKPKYFSTDKIDYTKKDFDRPLPKDKIKDPKKDSYQKDENEKKDFKKFRE